MPKLIKEKEKEYYEFRLVQDSIEKIKRFPIYIKISVEEREKREKSPISRNWDIAECFDCGWLSIEHLTAIRDFIH